MSNLNLSEVARSLELYILSKNLSDAATNGQIILEFTKEPFLRNREDVKNVVVAFGSYDPLSIAHEELFLKGLEVIREEQSTKSLDELVIVTSTTHFEKKIDWQKNSAIYDRVHAQEGFASSYNNVSLAFFNNPYFIKLAPAIQNKYGPQTKIHFIVGADVMIKIVDANEYVKRGIDPNNMWTQIFKNKFIVSERSVKIDGHETIIKLGDIIEKYPVLKKYSSQLIEVSLPKEHDKLMIPIQDVSSTLIRTKRNNHEDATALEAVGISDFVDRRYIYLEKGDKYAAFVCARQRFADNNKGKPIASYIGEVMQYLELLDNNSELRKKEINNYISNNKC